MEPIVEEFLALFPCRSDSAVKYGHGGNWRQISRFHQLSDAEILETLQPDTKLFRAFQFDTRTRFVVIHIPEGSDHHTVDSVVELREQIKKLGVNPRHYQFEDGWYFYIFLSDWVNSDNASQLLSQWCNNCGFEVAPASLQVYPAQDTVPFPLLPGFAWLNERGQTLVRREEISFDSAVALFLSDLTKAAVDPIILLELLESSLPTVATAEKLLRIEDTSSLSASEKTFEWWPRLEDLDLIVEEASPVNGLLLLEDTSSANKHRNLLIHEDAPIYEEEETSILENVTSIDIDPNHSSAEHDTPISMDANPSVTEDATPISMDPNPLVTEDATPISMDPNPSVTEATPISMDPNPSVTEDATPISMDPNPSILEDVYAFDAAPNHSVLDGEVQNISNSLDMTPPEAKAPSAPSTKRQKRKKKKDRKRRSTPVTREAGPIQGDQLTLPFVPPISSQHFMSVPTSSPQGDCPPQ